MNIGLAEKQEIYRGRTKPLLYMVKTEEDGNTCRNVVYTGSGLFYIFVLIIILACTGLLLNVGLKIQGTNYQKEINEINEMILLENERADRLQLKISELKSPARIIEVAQNDLDMDISEDSLVVEISNSEFDNNAIINDYIARNTDEVATNYDGFLSTVYYIQDIAMVVSESVLTFFIP
jgi:cell division protein FtsL